MVETCYISTVFKEPEILERFVEHIVTRIDSSSLCLIYCHDDETYNMSQSWDIENIIFIKGREEVFYTEAINILLSMGFKNYHAKQFCILDTDCYISVNFHQVLKTNIGRAGIFKNIDITTRQNLPAGFLITNSLLGSAVDIENWHRNRQVLEIDYSNGRGLFFPAYALDKIGYLNENFAIYGSDNEYSYRLGKHIGLRYYRAATVYSHKHETGDNFVFKSISWKKRLSSLWSKRSSSNLKTRFLFCWYVAPNRLAFILWALRSCTNAVLINIFGRWILRFTKYK
jgi:GT2 family glycosyltransferase